MRLRLRHLLLTLLTSSTFCGGGRGAAPAGGPPGGDPAAARPVTVITTAVEQRDVPIYLDGLGSVTAFKTVTVRSQVDGKLDKVLFTEGQQVKRGEVLVQIDPRPFLAQLHQAEGSLARDLAMLSNTNLNLKRYDGLRQQNLIAQQQVDDQQASVGQYQGAVAVDRAQIETAKLNLDYSRVMAPIDGITGVRLVDEGNVVRASDPGGLVIITQIDPIAVIFTLPEDDLQKLVKQMNQGKLTVDAFSREGTTKLATGELLVLDNQINQTTATLRLKAIFPNPQRQLWPNQFVKARLLLRTEQGALVVPAQAVQRGTKGPFVYVVASDQTASPRPIEIESLTGDLALIGKGLAAGEQVVVEGQNQLKPGSKVAARPLHPPAGGAAKEGGGPATESGGQRPGGKRAGGERGQPTSGGGQ